MWELLYINVEICINLYKFSGFRSPCEHGGSCRNVPGSFTCDCVTGFEGDRCERDIPECASNPCQNNGQCIDHRGYFECLCTRGKNTVRKVWGYSI